MAPKQIEVKNKNLHRSRELDKSQQNIDRRTFIYLKHPIVSERADRSELFYEFNGTNVKLSLYFIKMLLKLWLFY